VSEFEDRLRNAYLRATETIEPGSMRPAVLEPVPLSRDPVRLSRRGVRLARGRVGRRIRFFGSFAPVAAAVAVAVIVAMSVSLPRVLSRGPATPASASASASASARSAATPRFLAVIRLSGLLDIDSVATGRVLTSVSPPRAGLTWGDVAAVGPAEFLLTATSGALSSCGSTFLYTVAVSGGTVTAARPYAVPEVTGSPAGAFSPGFLAVSADASTVALITNGCGSAPDAIVVVRGGRTRTWTVPASAGPRGLSLSADGSELGYVDLPVQTLTTSPGSAWILPTTAAPGPAGQRGHEIFADAGHAAAAAAEVLSPDGKTMYLLTATGQESPFTDALSAYDVSTGTRLRTLATWDHVALYPPAITAAGDNALVWYLSSTTVIAQVDLATGAIAERRLPEPAADPAEDIAW
jgi:hypothetical protein